MVKSVVSVQEVPFQVSVFPTGAVFVSPPKTINDVLPEPEAPALLLAVFNSAISVQDEPFQDSLYIPL